MHVERRTLVNQMTGDVLVVSRSSDFVTSVRACVRAWCRSGVPVPQRDVRGTAAGVSVQRLRPGGASRRRYRPAGRRLYRLRPAEDTRPGLSHLVPSITIAVEPAGRTNRQGQ